LDGEDLGHSEIESRRLRLPKAVWGESYSYRIQQGEETMKKTRVSSARGAPAEKKEKGMKSRKINFSDIPELSDKQLSSMRRVGRPTVGDEARKLIAIRLDAKVLGWLRKTAEKKGLPYQSLVNEILASEMRKAS
jgi:uncharacterized protein (DUF4415 family)